MASQSDGSPRLTHVSIIAEDVEESAAFYEEVVGCERIPTPTFGKQDDFDAEEDISFQIVRVGDQQLHLWNDPAREVVPEVELLVPDPQLHLWNDPAREVEATRFAHFGVHVDDFEAVYRRAEERDVFAAIGVESAPPKVFEFNGTAQLYLRDPTGNLLEVDYPDIDDLDHSVFDEVVSRETSGPDIGVYTAEVLESIRSGTRD